MHTGMFTGPLAQSVHAYPTWSLAIQQTVAQFVGSMNVGGCPKQHPGGRAAQTHSRPPRSRTSAAASGLMSTCMNLSFTGPAGSAPIGAWRVGVAASVFQTDVCQLG